MILENLKDLAIVLGSIFVSAMIVCFLVALGYWLNDKLPEWAKAIIGFAIIAYLIGGVVYGLGYGLSHPVEYDPYYYQEDDVWPRR